MDPEFLESLKKCIDNQNRIIETLISERQNIDQNGTQHEQTVEMVPTFEQFSSKEDWESYHLRLEEHFKAYNVASEDKKRSFFLSWVGSDTFVLIQKLFGCADVGSKPYKDIIAQLTEYFVSKTHVLASRYKFLRSEMKPGQSYSEWVTELRGIARSCNFNCAKSGCNQSSVDDSIRDVIVLHTPHDFVRTQALQMVNPSLNDVMKIASTFETTQAAKQIITENTNAPDSAVFQVVSSRRRNSWSPSSRSSKMESRPSSNPVTSKQPTSNFSWNQGKDKSDSSQLDVPNFRKSCPSCFATHQRRNCRFYKATCNNCGKLGHISKVCCSQVVNIIEEVHSLSQPITETNSRYYIDVLVNEKPVKMTLDSGATCSMIGPDTYEILGKPPLNPPSSFLKAYGGVQVPLKGWFLANVTLKSESRQLRLLVTNSTKGANIFGTPWFHAFNITITAPFSDVVNMLSAKADSESNIKTKIDEITKKHTSIFKPGLGKCTSFKASLHLKNGVRPRFFQPRPIPFSQHEAVKMEIDRLLELGIIKPIKFSQWAAPVVIVSKPNNKVRLCGDFKVTINPQIDVERYPIPRFEDLLYKLKGGKRFSKVDLSDAYLQLELDEESKQLTVINTPFGLFQYQRLPFGVSSAPAIFQSFLEQTITGIPGCVNYLDDIIVTGRDTDEHLSNLDQLFTRLQENGLRCNMNKCDFFQEEVEYLGNILSESGVRPSESKVEALKSLPRPKNISELQSFLGKMTYYHRFIPNFATIAAPLNRLKKKDTLFKWGNEEETAFQKLKASLVNATRLVPYNSDFPAVLATDASSYGVGAVLSLQYPDGSERPIAFASKTLNDTEKGYSQIEKEALSIIFGVKKFHQYLHGRSFELITDHKPLVSLFHPDKQLPVYTLARLQRWAITLMSYQFTIRYRATNKHQNADALSRLPCGPDTTFDKLEDCCNWITEDMTDTISAFPISYKQVAEETSKDPILRDVIFYILKGWPNTSPSSELQPFFDRRHVLTAQSGIIILQGEYSRIVVPSKLKTAVLQLLHTAHWGIVRMKQMARRHCWWFHMDQDIENVTKSCLQCQQVQPNPKQEFKSWPAPSKPWERIHIDFAGPYWKSMWLIVVDAYSKFPFVVKLNTTTTESTTSALRQIFLLEGPPDTLVSDNGTQLTSIAFKDFCAKAGISHLTTAPFHPSSNGEAERFVRTFKNAMNKAWLENKNKDDALNSVLFTYRTTPNPSTGKSPSELLHGRQPKTLLDFLHPPSQRTQHEKQSTKFRVGDKVLTKFFSGPKWWVEGVVTSVSGRIMYNINTERGMVVRHQNQLRPLQSTSVHYRREQSTSNQNLKSEGANGANYPYSVMPVLTEQTKDNKTEVQPGVVEVNQDVRLQAEFENSEVASEHVTQSPNQSSSTTPTRSQGSTHTSPSVQNEVTDVPLRRVQFQLPEPEINQDIIKLPRRSERVSRRPERYSP